MPYGTRSRCGRPRRRKSVNCSGRRRCRHAPVGYSNRRRYRYEPVERFRPSDTGSDFANASAALTLCALAAPLVAGVAGFLIARWLLRPVLRALRREAAGARRRGLAAAACAQKAMRVVHRTSRREPPSRELLLRCWEMSRDSLEGKILLGSLLGDADAAADHSYIRGDNGEIVGRRGGVRRWLDAVCPELAPFYKTLMRYKALADKFRRVCGLGDPDGAEDALAPGLISDLKFQISGFPPAPAAKLAAARQKARELLAAHRTMKALDDALWAALGLVRMRRRPAAA